jgi:hypothetical protein
MIAKATKEILQAGSFLSAENMEKIAEEPGFRIQDYRFDCRQINDSEWIYTSSDGQLTNRVTVRKVEANTFRRRNRRRRVPSRGVSKVGYYLWARREN